MKIREQDTTDMNDFTEYLSSLGLGSEGIESALRNLGEMQVFFADRGLKTDGVTVRDIREYFDELISSGKNSLGRIIDVARYFKMKQNHDVFIYIVSTFSGREVLESISDKLISDMGTDCRTRIFEDLVEPPLGSPPECNVHNTCIMVHRLLDEGLDVCHDILADNHHGIPRKSFDRFAELYRNSDSIDEFLRKLHRMRVQELEEHLEEGKTWFEQEITPEVVELVRGNQEILSAVRKGDYLYVTKIPYAPGRWLLETDRTRKRYLACHCPLARESILMDDVEIPGDWCYCSGGFQKRMFDVLFNEFTEVELLESVLAGDDRCRFRIRLP